MFFQRLKTPGLGHNSYILACGDGLAGVIDTSSPEAFAATHIPADHNIDSVEDITAARCSWQHIGEAPRGKDRTHAIGYR